jgi:hypothetical protein
MSCPQLPILNIKDVGEYKIRPYKGFRDRGRGEPCVHPLVLRQHPLWGPISTNDK